MLSGEGYRSFLEAAGRGDIRNNSTVRVTGISGVFFHVYIFGGHVKLRYKDTEIENAANVIGEKRKWEYEP